MLGMRRNRLRVTLNPTGPRLTSIMIGLVACLALVAGCGASDQAGEFSDSSKTASRSDSTSEPAATTETDKASNNPCVLATDQVEVSLSRWVKGPVVISQDPEDLGAKFCTYELSSGSYGEDGISFTIFKYAYADNETFTDSSSQGERTYGGSTPEDVYGSSYIAYRDVQAGGRLDPVTRTPEIGNGLTTDGKLGFTLAGTGDYWYKVDFYNLRPKVEFLPASVKMATAIAATES